MSLRATEPQTIVIIGGVAGGMSTATRLRRINETATIIVLERGGEVSFANCGLPYHVGGVIPDRGSLVLQKPDQLKRRFNIDVHVRTEATAINRADKTVSALDLITGEDRDFLYDALVLSPGSTPFRPPIPGVTEAHVLWNLDDMDALIASAEKARSAIVVGGGFIGLELAVFRPPFLKHCPSSCPRSTWKWRGPWWSALDSQAWTSGSALS